MTISTSDQQDYETKLLDYAKSGRESLEAWVKGANLGQREPNDDEFKLWFETQAAQQVDWLRALQCRKADDPTKPAVDGADELLARYRRVVVKAQMGMMQ